MISTSEQRSGKLRRRAADVLAWLCLASLASAHAWAAGDDKQARAQAKYNEAKERYDAGDFQRATDLATEADALFFHPAIVLMKGRALRKVGKLREAQEAFSRADTPQLPKPLVRVLNDEKALLADELKIKGEVWVEVTPETALVSLAGDTGKGGLRKWLLAGKHRIEAEAPGYTAVSRSVEVLPGATATVRLRLNRKGGSVMVIVGGGLRGVDVLVDGEPLEIPDEARAGDRTPQKSVAVGDHEVVCVRGAKRVTQKARVEMDAVVDVRCEGIEPAGAPVAKGKVFGWGGVAVGAGLLGWGLFNVGDYAAQTSAGKVEKVGDCALCMSRLSGGIGYSVVGAAVGVTSALLFLRESTPAPAATADAR
jgi:hypothetical protein